MFIRVIYKDANEMIVNPNCYIRLIYEYIRIKANVTEGVEIDLCDSKGVLKKIFEPPYYKSGLELLENKETYYLITYQQDEKNGKMKPIPYISLSNPLYENLLKKLEPSKFLKGTSEQSKNDEGSAVVVTDLVKKKKKKKQNKNNVAIKSSKFPSFVAEKLEVMKPNHHRDGRKKPIHENKNINKNTKKNHTLLTSRKKSWYISPSDESTSIKKQNKKMNSVGTLFKN